MPLLLLLLLPVVWEAPLAQRLELRQNVTVQEGLCVFVPCRFSLPWVSFGKFYMFWFRERADTKRDPPVATNKPEQKLREGTQGRFSVPGEPQAGNCSLSITDVNAGDSGTYFFQVETHFRKYAYLNKMLFLNVIGTVGSLRERKGHGKPGLGWGRHDKTPGQANKMPRGPALSFSLPSPALTHQPHVRSPGALEPGRPGNLTCSVPWACERATPPIFSWTSAAPSSLGPRTPFSSVITLTPRPQDHGTRLTCQVKFPTSGVMVKRTILLNVTYAPQHVAISIFQGNRTALKILQNTSSLPVQEGQALQLLCVADSNPPAQLSWFRGSPALEATPISSTGVLELPCVGAAEEGEFTCRAQNPLGSQNISLSLSVVSPPQLLGPSCSQEDEGLRCSCSSQARPAPSLRWRLGKGLLEGNFSNASFEISSSSAGPWANGSLSLREGLSSGLSLSCEALNVHGAQSGSVLLLPGKRQPWAGKVLGAVGGAGITVLLSLCLYLIFRVKTHRKTQPVQSMDDTNQAGGSGSRERQPQFWTDTPADHPAPAGAGPISRNEQELHYAFLQFHKPKPQKQESTHTEYSEIKIHK
ncbi:sialic acid-binding Ig-like lectin 5 isoform X1 [Bos indicus x Bos taurus]|uniref:sialic acid-binding Ig-like lectin 5 isoform X1 n=1 Tax=Bos indicus x Bos taurus TaxID=30522 RepID=UPI000572BFC9|nr:sialic acid-binding Ig-like lectin 5 isoform X1 [Bos indicus x Bos taurus]XP_059733108.1 sialic acid-binding Ig-like lectin 5 isoform X4 [Bos taurus]